VGWRLFNHWHLSSLTGSEKLYNFFVVHNTVTSLCSGDCSGGYVTSYILKKCIRTTTQASYWVKMEDILAVSLLSHSLNMWTLFCVYLTIVCSLLKQWDSYFHTSCGLAYHYYLSLRWNESNCIHGGLVRPQHYLKVSLYWPLKNLSQLLKWYILCWLASSYTNSQTTITHNLWEMCDCVLGVCEHPLPLHQCMRNFLCIPFKFATSTEMIIGGFTPCVI
jgi:hypothetical protein